jgi:aryl-alcohol dehydrogenase-like predicted oxidoreductase
MQFEHTLSISLFYPLRSAAGIVPIPGAKSLAQAKDALGALDWKLEDNEVEMINEKLAAINK